MMISHKAVPDGPSSGYLFSL